MFKRTATKPHLLIPEKRLSPSDNSNGNNTSQKTFKCENELHTFSGEVQCRHLLGKTGAADWVVQQMSHLCEAAAAFSPRAPKAVNTPNKPSRFYFNNDIQHNTCSGDCLVISFAI